MTALCGGGTSGPQSGVGGVLTLGATAIEVFVSSVLLLPELAPVVAPIIAGIVDIDIANYCSTDPPADPGLTALDIATALAFPPTVSTFTAQRKILTWFEAHYWYQICQCTSITTPGPPAPSNPGTVTSNPGLPVQATPCWNTTVPYRVPAAPTSTTSNGVDLTPIVIPAGPVRTETLITSTPPFQGVSVPVVPGATNLQLSFTTNEAFSNTTKSILAHWVGWDGVTVGVGGDITTAVIFGTGSPGSATEFVAPHFNPEKRWTVWIENQDAIAHTGQLNIQFICPAGTTVGPACCPPDPLLEGELEQILQYVQAIYAGLPIAPTSFAEGTVHSGLTGAGNITFSGVPIALKMVLTTVPSWIGVAIGNPTFYFDVGFVSFGTSEGNYESHRVTYVDQVLTVPVLAGSLAYSLENGVIASVTELLAGP